VLGSRNTYLRGRFGGFAGRALQAGDVIPIGKSSFNIERAGRYLPQDKRPRYDDKMIEVILGPQEDHFSEETIQIFLSSEYEITSTSDRMGYRLNGPALTHRGSPDIISDGMVLGAIQIPANGQPILMMSDHATTGGYPKIAAVVSADISVVAQHLSVGAGLAPARVGQPQGLTLRLKQTTIESAQARYRAMMRNLKQIVEPAENFYFG
ncbi:MAG: KipI antagonist, partial [Chloroflexi bacterium]|nr:KipI antagonist [Chloroflexota bacterium]